jgi:hypothetical protein
LTPERERERGGSGQPQDSCGRGKAALFRDIERRHAFGVSCVAIGAVLQEHCDDGVTVSRSSSVQRRPSAVGLSRLAIHVRASLNQQLDA